MLRMFVLLATAVVLMARPQLRSRESKILANLQNTDEEPFAKPLRVPNSAPLLESFPVARGQPKRVQQTDAEQFQNQHASYQFSSNVDDKINDLTQQRTEQRDGLTVKGSYSYSDGYTKRTVHYIADENGYRVTGEEAIPLDGPHIDLSGTASVDSAAHGTQLSYRVQSIPVPGPVGKIIDH